MRGLGVIALEIESIDGVDNARAHQMGPHAVCDSSAELNIGGHHARQFRPVIAAGRPFSGPHIDRGVRSAASQRPLAHISSRVHGVRAGRPVRDFNRRVADRIDLDTVEDYGRHKCRLRQQKALNSRASRKTVRGNEVG